MRFLKQMMNLLTIAGSDSSGGAGIQADIKTFAAHGAFGMSVITAVTAQNTCGVTAVQNISEDMIRKQIDAIFEDITVHGVKIGMVSDINIIKCIAERLRFYKPNIIVLDPVMISKSGYNLLEENACEALCQELLPLATLITPNLPEAAVICGFEVTDKDDMLKAAKHIQAMGARNVLIKGGHLEDTADDLLYDGQEAIWFNGKKINTTNTHGTGCTLSSSLLSNLTRGMNVQQAVSTSKVYITNAIANAIALGRGCGPTNHFVDLYKMAGWL